MRSNIEIRTLSNGQPYLYLPQLAQYLPFPPPVVHTPFDPIHTSTIFPLPPPPLGISSAITSFDIFNAPISMIPSPFTPLLPIQLPLPLPFPFVAVPPPPPLMSLRISTPPTFRPHPYHTDLATNTTRTRGRHDEEAKIQRRLADIRREVIATRLNQQLRRPNQSNGNSESEREDPVINK
ncbi:unnamed protein product [Caenorhabditis sp. 36 PRJEB53466]|nr:unnamed protein product [Caenorhabditis sp. 36 PRJEB53466]